MPTVLKPAPETYRLAGELIRRGKVIVVPTDAVYAVVCDASNPEAVARLRQLRQSPSDKPLSLIMDKQIIEEYAIIPNDTYRRIVDLLLPGKVSFLMYKKGHVFPEAVPNEALCVFWQNNETQEVYKESRAVLAISSANIASNPEATTVEQAVQYFGDQIELYIDSGEERGNKGTTQVDIRNGGFRIMRESPLCPLDEIKARLSQNGISIAV